MNPSLTPVSPARCAAWLDCTWTQDPGEVSEVSEIWMRSEKDRMARDTGIWPWTRVLVAVTLGTRVGRGDIRHGVSKDNLMPGFEESKVSIQ